MKVPLYVLTSDHYTDALPAFAHLLNKYWWPHPEVIVGGFTPPTFSLPSNFSFYSIGKFQDYPVNRWSDALIKMLVDLPHEVFALMLEDYWLYREVDDEAVSIMADYMHQFTYVARFDLTTDRKMSGYAKPYGDAGKVKLVISDPDSQYHCSLMAALWRRSHLLRILVKGETPWDVELNGTPRLSSLRHEVIVLGSENAPVRHTLALRGGEHGKLLLSELPRADVDEMTQLGLLKPWGLG